MNGRRTGVKTSVAQNLAYRSGLLFLSHSIEYRMRHCLLLLLMIFCATVLTLVADESGFGAHATITLRGDGSLSVKITLTAPSDGVIPREGLALEAEESDVMYAISLAESSPLSSSEMYPEGVFHNGDYLNYIVTPATPRPKLYFTLQGCTASICYLPQKICLDDDTTKTPAGAAIVGGSLQDFVVVRARVGYANAEEFAAWLNGDEDDDDSNLLRCVFEQYGAVFALLLTVVLGVLLNLTPCVLPMIPITLGILGARGVSRKRGALLGACYGGAMALTYGILGVIFLLIGGQFSSMSASGWFNLIIALVFIVLSGAMADLYSLDFSRFRKMPSDSQRNSVFGAFVLGGMTALMAGACVAPALLWVLILATDLHAQGNAIAWLLPLALGVGLGALWPLLGGGVASLPRPGKWMTNLKRLVAVMILLFGLYYLLVAITIFRGKTHTDDADTLWRTDIAAALTEARQTGKPLLIDFWGVACKSCVAMDATTMREPTVREAMKQYICLKIQGDRKDATDAQKLMQYCAVIGFPTYVVLQSQTP